MANLRDLVDKFKQNFSDDKGWFRQGNFTPQKQIQQIQSQSPVSSFGPLTIPNFKNQQVRNLYSSVNTPEKQQAFNQQPVKGIGQNLNSYVMNNYVAPITQVPYNAKQVIGKDKTALERGVGALGVLGGTLAMIPDPIGDIALPAYNYLKGVTAAQKRGEGTIQSYKTGISSLTGQKPVGLGEALSSDPTKQNIGNIAELPLMFAVTGKIGKTKANRQMILNSAEEVAKYSTLAKNYDRLRPEIQVHVFEKMAELGKKVIPQVVNNKEMKSISLRDPQAWLKYTSNYLDDAVMNARHPELNFGFNTRTIKKSDQSKGVIPEVGGVTDVTNNPIYKEVSIAKSKLMEKVNSIQGKYKTDADMPKPLLDEINKLNADYNTKFDKWNEWTKTVNQSPSIPEVKTNGIKIKSNQVEPVRIGQLGQPNLQNGQPVVSKTNIKLLDKTKTIENPILPTSQNIVPKERGLVTSVKQAQDISEPVKVGTQGTYTPKPNEVLMGEAKALLSDGATIDFKNTQGLDKKVAATIQEAINLDKAGSHEAAANLYNNLSTHATELGRGVQAFSLLDRMSPEAIALSAAGKIKKYNLTATRKIPELGGDQVKMISDKVKLIDTLTGRDKNIAINELSNTINDFIPSSLGDKAITVWKAGLLTSLRTHERNLLGNAIHGGAEVAKDVIASPADWLLSLKTGQRTKTFTTKGLGQFGSKTTGQQVADIVSKGYDPSDAISKFDHKRINWGNNPVEQTLKKYTDTVFRVLGAADKPFYNAAYARSLYDQAAAEAINVGQRGSKTFIEKLVLNPTEQMLKTAISDANVATFHNKNVVSNVATGLKNTLGKNELGKVIGDIAMPFTGVPSAIAGQTVAYSPVGLIKGAIDFGRVLMSDIPGLQRQAAEEVGRGVIGTGLFAMGAYLMSRGLMTGQPKDANESAIWATQGKQANSVLIGGKWRSINSIGPENIVILAGAKLKDEMSKPDGSLANYAFGVGKDQLSQTFLAGVQGPLNAITDPNRYGKSYAGNQAASIIPNIVKDASKALDPYARENNTIQDYMKSGIPGARNTLLPRRDNLGNIIPQEPTGIKAFYDLFNSKTPIDNAVVNEISRLYNTGNNALPSKLSTSQTILKQKTKLTFEQLNNLEAGVGEALKPKLETLISSPVYQSLTDEKKTKAIDTLVADTREKYKNLNAGNITGGQVTTSPIENTLIAEPKLTGNKTIDDKLKLQYKNAVTKQQVESANIPDQVSNPDMVFDYVDEDGNYKTVDLTPITFPKMTGNTVIDKKLKSSYYSSVNAQINDVIKLGQSGQITQDEMIAMVNTLNTQYTKGKAGKKAKAVAKIAKGSVPKISYKISAGKKMPMGVKIAKRPNLKALTSTKIVAPKLKYDTGKVANIKITKIKGLTVGRKIA